MYPILPAPGESIIRIGIVVKRWVHGICPCDQVHISEKKIVTPKRIAPVAHLLNDIGLLQFKVLPFL